jgi:mRNA-degrading endonuclease RelE of RelBE toxin-antitoxin system
MPPLEVSGRAARNLRALPPSERARLRATFDKIRDNPNAGKHLHGELAGLRSWRVGAFRIVYQYSQGTITIVTLDRRSTVYRRP